MSGGVAVPQNVHPGVFTTLACLDPLCQGQTELVSLSTGFVVPPNIASDLFKDHDIGEAYQNFKKDDLKNEPPTAKFHDKKNV